MFRVFGPLCAKLCALPHCQSNYSHTSFPGSFMSPLQRERWDKDSRSGWSRVFRKAEDDRRKKQRKNNKREVYPSRNFVFPDPTLEGENLTKNRTHLWWVGTPVELRGQISKIPKIYAASSNVTSSCKRWKLPQSIGLESPSLILPLVSGPFGLL